MARINRKNQKVFAGNAINNGQFGSLQLGTKILDNDLDVIQALSAFGNGWNDATVDSEKLLALEELQGLMYMSTSQLAYLFQEGLPEYNAETTYFTNSIVRKSGTYDLYGSIINDNIGNALPSQVTDANWQYLGNLSNLNSVGVAIGSIVDYGGVSAPIGYLNCDGSAVDRATYAGLFSAIGTLWGIGDGINTFNLPDLSRTTTIGSGGTGTGTIGNVVGNTGGEENHTLIEAEMPNHTHSLDTAEGDSGSSIRGAISGSVDAGVTNTDSTGSGTAHNNMQPSAVVMKIIKI